MLQILEFYRSDLHCSTAVLHGMLSYEHDKHLFVQDADAEHSQRQLRADLLLLHNGFTHVTRTTRGFLHIAFYDGLARRDGQPSLALVHADNVVRGQLLHLSIDR
jgi:hypothetical protein